MPGHWAFLEVRNTRAELGHRLGQEACLGGAILGLAFPRRGGGFVTELHKLADQLTAGRELGSSFVLSELRHTIVQRAEALDGLARIRDARELGQHAESHLFGLRVRGTCGRGCRGRRYWLLRGVARGRVREVCNAGVIRRGIHSITATRGRGQKFRDQRERGRAILASDHVHGLLRFVSAHRELN